MAVVRLRRKRAAMPPERRVDSRPADPGTVETCYALVGTDGTVSFSLLTWAEGHPTADEAQRFVDDWTTQFGRPLYPLAMDLGVHRAAPAEGSLRLACMYTDSGCCYYDGSASRANAVLARWGAVAYDVEWLWRFLLRMHEDEFGA